MINLSEGPVATSQLVGILSSIFRDLRIIQHHQDLLLGKFYSYPLQLKQNAISVLLRCQLTYNNFSATIKMNKSLPGLSDYLSGLLKLKQQQLILVVTDFNNSVDCKIMVEKDEGIILSRLTICLACFQQGNYKSFLQTCIKKQISDFTDFIERTMCRFKLGGCDSSGQSNNINSQALKKSAQKIVIFEQIFDLYECQLKVEPSGKNSLKLKPYAQKTKQISQLLKMISSGGYNENALGIQFTTDLLQGYKKKFKDEVKLIIRALIKQPGDKLDNILRAIQITKQLSQIKTVQTGGYAQVTMGRYCYIPYFSVNQIQLGCQQTEREGSLALKTAKVASVLGPIQNECCFLRLMRNKVCPFIAKYYCNKSAVPFQDGMIYMQYYPKSMESYGLCSQVPFLLKMYESLCLGLLFLQNQSIIHRDIKESNIMIDKWAEIKIIDFGSAGPILKNGVYGPFQPPHKRLSYTPEYSIVYHQACQEIPSLAQKMTQEEYQGHPNYDVYSLGKMLENQFQLHSETSIPSFALEHVKYLALRCMQTNPNDRWSLDKILIIVRELLNFEYLERKCWQSNFEKSFRPMSPNHFATRQEEDGLQIGTDQN